MGRPFVQCWYIYQEEAGRSSQQRQTYRALRLMMVSSA